jgi:hypothetical protein
MANMLVSPLWVGGEIFLGLSLTMFVGALIAVFGDRIRSGSHKSPEVVPRRVPSTGAFRLPVLDPPQLGPSRRIVEPGRLPTVGQIDAEGAFPTLAPRLAPAEGDHVARKGAARAVISRRAA